MWEIKNFSDLSLSLSLKTLFAHAATTFPPFMNRPMELKSSIKMINHLMSLMKSEKRQDGRHESVDRRSSSSQRNNDLHTNFYFILIIFYFLSFICWLCEKLNLQSEEHVADGRCMNNLNKILTILSGICSIDWSPCSTLQCSSKANIECSLSRDESQVSFLEADCNPINLIWI